MRRINLFYVILIQVYLLRTRNIEQPMSNYIAHSDKFPLGVEKELPAQITKAASKQSYYTICFLADRERVQDAFRAYAYFRWLDDQLDANTGTQQEKSELINRQQILLETCYRRELPEETTAEERMLVDLVRNDKGKDSRLQSYLRNMMDLMAFDVERRGRLISQVELTRYSRLLSAAVTEALFYFIDHQGDNDYTIGRYQAVCGAHVVHMLRDMSNDIAMGYFNIPSNYLETEQITLEDLNSQRMRKWVYGRVRLARKYFQVGKRYISQVKNLRFRLAGYSYLARFEWMLRVIEHEKYYLRPEYPERKSLKACIWMFWRVIMSLVNIPQGEREPVKPVILPEQGEEE